VVRGRFVKLDVVLDVWSRLIVGAMVHDVEDGCGPPSWSSGAASNSPRGARAWATMVGCVS